MNAESPRTIEIIAPLENAWKTMRHTLFEPFDLKKWCVIGFCAWLANLMSSGGGGGGGDYASDTENGDGAAEGVFSSVDWSSPLVLGLIGIATILVVIFIVIALWISSRGKFMFIDCIVHNRGAVREPWDKFKNAGNRLFIFQLLVGITWCVVIGAIVGIAIVSVVATDAAELFHGTTTIEPLVLIGVILAVIAVVLVIVALIVFYHLIENFVVPIMYCSDNSPLQALKAAWNLLLENIVAMLLYFLMTIGLGIASTIVVFVACCLTCCIALLPYVGTVIMLPVFVLLRAYAMHFVAQFDDAYECLDYHPPVQEDSTPALPQPPPPMVD